MIKKYGYVTMSFKEFDKVNEEAKKGDMYEYGCVLICPDISNWNEITSVIDEKDVYGVAPRYGVENDPHITLLYGLHSTVSEQDVRRVLKKFTNKKFEIDINGIGKFEQKKFDVVKLDISSKSIVNMNKALCSLPHTSSFPTFHPHMTISYVNPGTADKYVNKDYKASFISASRIIYTKTDGTKIEFTI